MAVTDTSLKAAARLNAEGLQHQRSEQLDEAVDAFSRASGMASALDVRQSLRYRLNAVRAMVEAGQSPLALEQLASVTGQLDSVAPAPELRLAVADLYRTLVNELGEAPEYRLRAFEQLTRAERELVADDHLLRSWVYGYQGALYEDEQRTEESSQLTRLAIAEAQRAASLSALFRWEWQLGRNLAEQDRAQDAIAAYARAADALSRQRLVSQDTLQSFDRIIRPLYYQYADLLLRQAVKAVDADEREALLQQVQESLEAVKTAELQDYFQERCIVENSKSLNDVGANTAVLYPVLLEDRLELIMTANGELSQVSVPASRFDVVDAIRDFRLNLQVDTATRDYLRLAGQLYGWLIAPLEERLSANRIQTLVIIPDGPLRTIPLAALHDGEQFLIERFSFATAPALNLVASPGDSAEDPLVFAGGISASVQGFRALPSVSAELDAVQNALAARVLENEAFTKQAVAEELAVGAYSIVHLATHGKFGGSYSDSFLLTHDDRLQMDELGDALLARSDEQGALDLLVLSACETAAGDDRAALGVAGVAVKSGARSAIASLWEVDDAATKQLIAAFYDNLAADAGGSKAESLRQAQRQLIQDEVFSHPSNWAPFLIVGDWL